MERAGRPVGDPAVELQDERCAVAAITASDLLYGVEGAGDAQRTLRRQACGESILQTLPDVASDLTVARVHANLGALLAARGSSIGPNDLLLAATAPTLGYDLATQSAREFRTVPGLVVRRPSW
jgi:tRNA(fMet)-specific endonuclease VapC